MIKTDTITLSMSEIEAKKTKAYIEKQATFDKDKSELTFTANTISGKSVGLIYHNGEAFTIVVGTQNIVTISIYTTEEFNTEEEAFSRIEVLGLEYDFPILEA